MTRATTPEGPAGSLVRVESVRKSYGSREILRDISMNIDQGEVLVIIGPSGSGKSTLLRCIAQLESIDSGIIRFGKEILGYEKRGGRLQALSESAQAAQRRRTGMVFQQFNLFPHMSVLDNVTYAPRKVLKHARPQAEAHARELLASVGLAEKAGSYPPQLSGGQQQRVAIARALAMQPELLLFDEPTSALDPELVGEVLRVMKQLAETGITMAVVTHEIDFAKEVASRCIFIDAGQIVEAGNAQDVLTCPQSSRLREFLKRTRRASP